MKKMFIIICMMMMAVIASIFVGCGKKHSHVYGEWIVTTMVTCTENGERTRICECGHEQTEKIDRLGHNFVENVCTDCGEIK